MPRSQRFPEYHVISTDNNQDMIEHPELRRILGRTQRADGVTEYLGLKYALLENKFAPPVLYEGNERSSAPVDATKLGPNLPGPDGCTFDQSLIQCNLPFDDAGGPIRQSALDCLTLNISVPVVSKDNCALPVLAYLHGGGLKNGSANWPQNRLANIVSYSAEIGMPMVGVSINYRQGALGFLTSKELRSFGYLGNNGLRDQRVALRWVKKFIRGFGGDEDNITLLGHSAGGVSSTLQLASEEPLFKRLIAMSGTFLALRPVSTAVQEEIYAQTMKILGFDQLSTAERIAALESIDANELMTKIPPFVPFAPVIDNDFCHETPTFAAIANGFSGNLNRGWCKEICIGDCQFDGSIISLGLAHRKANIVMEFTATLQRCFARADYDSSAILKAYGINQPVEANGHDDNANYIQILRFCQDVMFYAPAVTIAREWTSGNAYLYHFNEPNPWDGPWKGYASHILDIAFLFQNFNSYLGLPQQKLAKTFGADIVRFVYGQARWTKFETGATLDKAVSIVYGPSKQFGAVSVVRSEQEVHSAVIWDLMQKFGADKLLDATEAFLAGH